MKRLLIIVGGRMDTGGAETFVMKLYRKLDRAKYQFDFVVSASKQGYYDDEITQLGGKVHYVIEKTQNPFVFYPSLYKIVKSHKYKYVLRMGQNSLTAIDLLVAKIAGANRLVYRSANSYDTSKKKSFIHKLFFPFGMLVPNVKIAPSDLAASFMFGKRATEKGEVVLLNNGIPLENFSFNAEARREIRESIGVKDELLVGHIGRFGIQKNHKFLIEVFKELLKTAKAHLMLIGDGGLEDDIKRQVEKLGISDKVTFMGIRSDVPQLLSAMDVFLFPSLFEGMPNTVIEVQANGLPAVISDTITHSVQLVDNVHMLPLDASKAEWAETIKNCKRYPSEDSIVILRKAGYDINDVVAKFISIVFE